MGVCGSICGADNELPSAPPDPSTHVNARRVMQGEVWLSSQNRNFKNRMGKGSIANLASAAVVAASSFNFTVTDPAPLLAAVDPARYDALRQWAPSAATCHGATAAAAEPAPTFSISEPRPLLAGDVAAAGADPAALSDPAVWDYLPATVVGTVQRFGDGVDTDAIIPATFMGCSPADIVRYGGTAGMSEDAFLGLKCFGYVRPEFSARVAAGGTVVVAGAAFGCGSSREEAARALVNAGVRAVFAKSFAFIYSRNQPNFALLGGVVRDPRFYEQAEEGASVEVDVAARTVTVLLADGGRATYPFALSTMEERFLQAGGVERLYKAFRTELFKAVLKGPQAPRVLGAADGCGAAAEDAACGNVAAEAGVPAKALSW